MHSANEIFSTPKARTPLKNKIYKLQETPYLTNLRMALDQALDRPVTYHNRERHLVMICCIEQLAYPIILIVVLLVNLLRYLYLSDYVGVGHWTEVFLLQPIAVTLPLLPLVFPACWLALNCFGMARFKALFKLYQSSKKTQVCAADILRKIDRRTERDYLIPVCRTVRGRGYIGTEQSRGCLQLVRS